MILSGVVGDEGAVELTLIGMGGKDGRVVGLGGVETQRGGKSDTNSGMVAFRIIGEEILEINSEDLI